MPSEPSAIGTPTSAREVFYLGGLGALAPILLNLAIVDATTLSVAVSPAVLAGYAIRVAVLFVLGAFVAYLQNETDRFRAFQLGIAAPALLTGVINGHNLTVSSPMGGVPHARIEIGLVASAYADDTREADSRDRPPRRPDRDDRDADKRGKEPEAQPESFRAGLVRGILGRPADTAADHHKDQPQ